MAQIDEQIKQMQHLMYYKGEEAPVKRQTSLEYMREGVDGKTYGISHEGNSYYLKVTDKCGKGLVSEDFDYVGGFNNKGRVKYTSYTDAMKNLDMKLQEIRTSIGKKATIIESTNPEYKEILVTEATGDMAEFIKRQRQIMANMRVIEEGNMLSKPVGVEIGKVGDSEPFGEKSAEANQFAEKSGFEEKPKEANKDGEPAGAKTPGVGTGAKNANDGMKEVPGADNGVKAAEKPMMKEDKDFDEEDVDTTGADTQDGKDDVDTCPKCGKKPCECDTAEEGDKLQQILDRLDAIEKKITEMPFQEDEPVIPTDGEDTNDVDDTDLGLEPTGGEEGMSDIDAELNNSDDEDIHESAAPGIEWDDEVQDPDQEKIDAILKKYSFLDDTDAELAAIEGSPEANAAHAAADDDMRKAAEEEQAGK